MPLPRSLRWAVCAVFLLASSAQAVSDGDGDGLRDLFDNCPSVANAALQGVQPDADGDGVGDACECGDASGDGRVNTADVRLIQRCSVGEIPCGALCDANGDEKCNTTDARLVARLAVGQLGKRALRCATRPEPLPTGASEFVSAPTATATDARSSSWENGVPTADLVGADAPSAEERTVEEGDIYRVLGEGLILNLNAYRGLQVIDASDPSRPRIVGRLRVAGSPVELYVVGERAFVLLNGWHSYRAFFGDPALSRFEGGLVLAVDLRDPTAPREIDREPVEGTIRRSRLTRSGEQAALYVAAYRWVTQSNPDGSVVGENRTVVRSFDVSTGRVEPRSELDLGGSVVDIHATPQALLVARDHYTGTGFHSDVTLVDIRDPGGRMGVGNQIEVSGRVESQFNMDLHGRVLRIVSEGRADRTNHLETFDVSDFLAPKPIHHVTFGANESLFATLFLGNKAFFVTYRRVDPFHAFRIDDAGFATEMTEFVVSGWNDFFRPVLGDTRLIGVGVDDAAGNAQAVSVYDITDLRNPSPLLARATVAGTSTWSEASFDHRAFSVLENAVDVEGPGGARERGLVLLPFSGWDTARSTYTAAVQIFTFSERSVTPRGVMIHGSPVRRSFLTAPATAANLSETELSLYDAGNPDRPEELGRLRLAPDFTRVFRFGEALIRVSSSRSGYAWWWGTKAALPPSVVEVLPGDADPDAAEPLATFEIPSGASVHPVGSLLVSIDTQPVDTNAWPYAYRSTIAVHDLQDPTSPKLVATLETDRLQPRYFLDPWVGRIACLGCDLGYPLYVGPPDEVLVVPRGLVFPQRWTEREVLGLEEVCTTRPSETTGCFDARGWIPGCSYAAGTVTCVAFEGEEPACSGAISSCTLSAIGNVECTPIDPASTPTTTTCSPRERVRAWSRFRLEVLDLTAPQSPSFADAVELAREDLGVSTRTDGSDVWVTFTRDHVVPGDSREHTRYFLLPVDLSHPSEPHLGPEINVPGELVAVEGSALWTRDSQWSEDGIETAVASLELARGRAFLRARRHFPGRLVEAVLLDGAGQILVSHRPPWFWGWGALDFGMPGGVVAPVPDSPPEGPRLSVLDAPSLELLADVDIADWASLRTALVGRAVFHVPGGILLFNLDDPAQPFPQAFFPTRGFPQQILADGRRLLVPAGRYGIYSFDLDAFDLEPPTP